jgi:glutamate-1-semialdehyde 2,1-aminomutase
VLDLAEPAHELRQGAARNSISEKKIQLFLIEQALDAGSNRHAGVKIRVLHVDSMKLGSTALGFYGLGAAALTASVETLRRRLVLSKAKHRSMAGHSRLARRLASLVPSYEYDETTFFCSDGAPAEVAARRRDAFMRLAALYESRFAATRRRTAEVIDSISDLRFTDAYRVPFQYSRFVRRHLNSGAFMQSSAGVMLTDLDGNEFYDLTGSYGVNVLGYDFYKKTIALGLERVHALGPVLGPYHPVIAQNVKRLKEISGLDEVSFHMSGTEAVMQAVRLARYHTRRSHLVRFCGAYHGWWGDVQPGVGNPAPAHETYTLRDMAEETLRVLERRRDIACVLVNPLQALHPNAGAPADSSLVDSARHARFDREAYGNWLRRLRAVCSKRDIVLIFDEVFVGFRLGIGGAQEHFGVQADLVTYGKTVAGGLPIGVVCGRKELMKRFRDDRPADICFARGTFNSHPYVMAAMYEFLQQLETAEVRALYFNLDEVWNKRADRLNERLRAEGLPVQIANMSSIWTVCYTQPSRYNWMLQYYMRAEGLALSWVGTGRLIFSLNYTEADFNAVADRLMTAAQAMQQDGWWWHDPAMSNTAIKRQILKEMIAHRLSSKRDHPRE